MLDALLHRGPDQNGLWHSEGGGRGIVLGHRRLSILDLTEAGKQPMIHADTGVIISYNGECYNFAEIRERLKGLGHTFRSDSDTEVLLAAYIEWGIAATRQFRGMFAFAVWDPRIDSLFLVRDRLGIKPLYVTTQQNRLLFASELRALLATDLVPRSIDRLGLEAYLWHGYVPGPHTLVEDIKLIEPGVELEYGLDGQLKSKQKYWSLPQAASKPSTDDDVAQAGQALEDSVRLRMISDVPLGVFLSGGVDSSVLAALAQRSSSIPVRTFNVSFEERRYDESGFAREVAQQLGTEHDEVMLSESMFQSQLDDALDSLDQPTFDAINTYFISRAVKETGLTVALSGAGGDELFGGYPSFTEIPRAKALARGFGWIPQRPRASLTRFLTNLVVGRASEVRPQTRWGKLDDILATSGETVEAYQTSYALFTRQTHNQLLTDKKSELDWGLYPERLRAMREQIENQDDHAAVSQLELMSFVGERLLRDTDTSSMAVSLEVRVPLLDHQFLESLARVDASQRYTPLGSKKLLKQFAADQLDLRIFDRPKAGFELPLELWCKQSLGDRMGITMRDINLIHSIGLDAETVGRLWRAFQKAGPGIYWSRVWSIFVLLEWCRKHALSA